MLQVKSYLAGNPPIKIKLNDDLLITRRDGSSGPGFGGGGGYGSGFSSGDYAADSLVILEDANFHEVRQREGQLTAPSATTKQLITQQCCSTKPFSPL